MVRCSPIPATCTACHQRIVLSSASSMQSWPGYDSSLDFVTENFLTLESPANWGFRNSGSVRKVSRISSPPSSLSESHFKPPRRQDSQHNNLSSERPKRRASKQTRHRELARWL